MTAGCTVNCGNANKNWVDAFIQITPQNAANAVGTNHVLTITVNATGGGVLAAGTATASILTPPSTTGSFVGSPTCNYTGGAATATCTVTITSAVAGRTSVQATSRIGFTQRGRGGQGGRLGRPTTTTAGCAANCGNGEKSWVDAYIQIAPQNAANGGRQRPRAHDHGYRDQRWNARGGYGDGEHPHAAEHDRDLFSRRPVMQLRGWGCERDLHREDHLRDGGADPGPGDLERRLHQRGRDGVPDDGHGDNVTAGCTVNCGNADKNWVDAFIQITPQNAANAVGTNHVLTITVNATNGGVLAAGTATASILTPPSTTGSFVGSPTLQLHRRRGNRELHGHDHLGGRRHDEVQATSTIGFTNAVGTVTRTTGHGRQRDRRLHGQLREREQDLGATHSSRSRRRTRPTRPAPTTCSRSR